MNAQATLGVAIVTEVFHEDPGGEKLRAHLTAAKRLGAHLALLPELPLNPWSPATRDARDEDAEMIDGPRQRTMSEAARDAGIAVLGGAVVLELERGRRYNTAFLYGPDGSRVAAYRKVHLPAEEGYWETSHYEAGRKLPQVVERLPMRVGVQICSDVNRPEGTHILAAAGAEVILVPRATPPETYDRWRLVMRANAVTSGAYVVSANRPRPEQGASIGGPSLVIAPTGEVIAETEEPLKVVKLERRVVQAAAREYPGYLKRFPRLYAEGWGRLADGGKRR